MFRPGGITRSLKGTLFMKSIRETTIQYRQTGKYAVRALFYLQNTVIPLRQSIHNYFHEAVQSGLNRRVSPKHNNNGFLTIYTHIHTHSRNCSNQRVSPSSVNMDPFSFAHTYLHDIVCEQPGKTRTVHNEGNYVALAKRNIGYIQQNTKIFNRFMIVCSL